MSEYFTNQAEIQAQIDAALNSGMDEKTKNIVARSIRATSFSSQKKANSFQTIMSISNTMVGTSTLVLPILFRDIGLITSILVSIVIAIISAKTSQLLVEHNKIEELDLPETIIRILGLRWQQIYNVSNVTLLYLSGIIYMILICNQIYPLLCIILDDFGIKYADQTVISFSQISYQWIGIAYFFIIFPLMCLRNLGVILKIVPLGFVSVVTFFIFIIYKGIMNVSKKGLSIFDNLLLFTTEVPTIAGVFTMGLMIQSLIIPITKNNQFQSNNKRDINIAYSWTWLVYQMVGLFGLLSIIGVEQRNGTSGQIVLDFYEIDWMVMIIQILLLLQLTFVFPVLQFITRAQFFVLLYGVEKPPVWQFYGFTLFYALSCLFMQMIEADLSLIISLCGAIIGMFQIYIIPIALHLTCLYKKRTQVEDHKIKANIQSAEGFKQSLTETSSFIDYVDMTKFNPDDVDIKCNNHDKSQKRLTKLPRYLIYSSIAMFGIFIAVAKVYGVILQ